MKALTKDHQDRISQVTQSVSEAYEALEEAVTAFNETVEDKFTAVEEAVEKYNVALEEADSVRSDIVDEMNEFISEHSEKWQEGERGSAIVSWAQEWENAEFPQVEIDRPDDIQVPDHATPEPFADLPEDAGV